MITIATLQMVPLLQAKRGFGIACLRLRLLCVSISYLILMREERAVILLDTMEVGCLMKMTSLGRLARITFLSTSSGSKFFRAYNIGDKVRYSPHPSRDVSCFEDSLI